MYPVKPQLFADFEALFSFDIATGRIKAMRPFSANLGASSTDFNASAWTPMPFPNPLPAEGPNSKPEVLVFHPVDDAAPILPGAGTPGPNLQTFPGGGNGISGSRQSVSSFNPLLEGPGGQSSQNLLTGVKWGGAMGTSVSMTYSLASASSVYGYSDDATPGRQAMVAAQAVAVTSALAMISASSGITFTALTDSASQAGDIRFGNSTSSTPNFQTAYGYFPNTDPRGGDIWFRSAIASYQNPVVGGYGYATFVHEIGHAIGLTHPHEGPTPARPGEDQLKYSVMSYRSYDGAPLTGYTTAAYPTTLMINDVLALQSLYGVNTTFRTGNDSYSWAASARVFETIWDAGGIDTLDASNQTQGARIYLTPGKWTEIGTAFSNGQSMVRNNLTIAYGAVIENAIGSNLNDYLEGNTAANQLSGGLGNDTLDGGSGNDTLDGGSGDDQISAGSGVDVVVGGVGSDTLVLSGNFASYVISRPNAIDLLLVNSATLQNVTLREAEFVAFADGTRAAATLGLSGGPTAGNDTLVGTAGDDTIDGLGGDDSISGLGGNDSLIGGSGNDTLDGGDGYDTLVGGLGSDRLVGVINDDIADYSSAGAAVVVNMLANTVSGGAGNDILVGINRIWGSAFNDSFTSGTEYFYEYTPGAGNDSVLGGAGYDYVYDGAGDDYFDGSGGFDLAIYFWATGPINANLATGRITGQGNDTVLGVEALYATNFNDTLTAAPGGTSFYPQGGNDLIVGGAGYDSVEFQEPGNLLIDMPAGRATSATGDDTFSGIEGITSGKGNDTLLGDLQGNNLDGGQGNDSINGGGGNDYIVGNFGNDFVDGGTGNDTYSDRTYTQDLGFNVNLVIGRAVMGAETDTLVSIENVSGTFYNDTLTGDSQDNRLDGWYGNDSLNGGSGNDVLVPGRGVDTLDGGADTDVAGVSANRANYVITQVNATDIRLVYAAGGENLTIRNIEFIDFADGRQSVATLFNAQPTPGNDTLTGSAGNDTLDGLAGNDSISGLAGNDLLIGGSGNDTLVGGPGDDVLVIDVLSDVVVEAADEGTDTVNVGLVSAGIFTLPTHVEHATVTAAAGVAVNLVGNALDNRLTGNAAGNNLSGGAGHDTLDGGAGNDTLAGGAGNDMYLVDSLADVVDETAVGSDGNDHIELRLTAAATYTLPAAVESLRVANNLALNLRLVGNTLGNNITGGSGNDTVEGAAGPDYLRGGLGNDSIDGGSDVDWVAFQSATGPVSANLITGVATGEGTDTLVGIENVAGSPFADSLVGDGVGNYLQGGEGNDTLDGGLGDDRLEPGLGNDSVVGGDGSDTAYFTASATAVNASLVTGLATGEGTDTLVSIERLSGSNFNDTLEGNTGANQLSGGKGNDTLIGGDGNDTLYGNDGNDLLQGGAGVDFLTGGAGVDTLDGGADNDVISFEDAPAGVVVNLRNAVITNDGYGNAEIGSNIENIHGSRFSDAIQLGGTGGYVFGRAGNDTLTGDVSNDNLIPGSGADVIDGGAGNDYANYYDDGSDGAGAGTQGVNANLVTGLAVDNWGFTDTLVRIENLGGGPLADTLTGDANNNTISAGDGNDNVTGGAGNDRLLGQRDNDTLQGGDGNDYMTGGLGNDSIVGGAGTDTADYFFDEALATAINANLVTGVVTGGAGTDTLSGIENLNGSALNDTLLGDALANLLEGRAGNDSISGGLGNDSLFGGDGNDTLLGNEGSDFFRGGAGDDSIDGAPVLDRVNYTDGNSVSYSDSTAAVNINLSGVSGDGSVGFGTASDGFGGTDKLVNTPWFTGSPHNDIYLGSQALIFEQVEGGLGNDTLDGGVILDTLNTRDGNRVNYNAAPSAVTVDLQAGTATGGAGNDVLSNFNQIRGSAHGDTLRGTDTTVFTEHFNGLAGDDLIDGRGGFDVVRYDNAAAPVTLDLVAGTASDGQGGFDTLLNIEGVLASPFNDVLMGGNPANGTDRSVYGPLEIFRGSGGNDTIDGGQGFDRVDYNDATTGVLVTLRDTLDGSASDGLGGTDVLRNVEGVRGSFFNDTLIGSDTAPLERFEGREGNDSIDGKGGTDLADYNFSYTGVNVNLATGTAADGYGGTDTLLNIEQVRGSRDSNDTLTGNAAANQLDGQGGNDSLSGGAGNDTLLAGTGIDTLDGGADNDTALVIGNFASYSVQRPTATDVVLLNGTTLENITLRNIENVQFADGTRLLADIIVNAASPGNDTLTGTAGNDSIDGLAGNDSISGLAGNDTLIGGSGIDTLVGGTGDDTLVVDVAGDVVTELPGEGTDTVQVAFVAAGSYTLPANVENATVTAAAGIAANVVGNELNNRLIGNAAANNLQGGDGSDTLVGGLGNDSLDGGAGTSDWADYLAGPAAAGVNVNLLTGTASGGAGSDTLVNVENLRGTAFGDTLIGSAGNNFIEGYAGNDSILGGAGGDFIRPGTGADTVDGGHASEGNVLTYDIDGGINGITMNLSGITGDGSVGTGTVIDTAGHTDIVSNFSFYGGTSQNDSMLGSAAALLEDFNGIRGNDTIDGGAMDAVASPVNSNRVNFVNSTTPVTVDLAAGTASWAQGTNVLSRINWIRGGSADDTIRGSDDAVRTEQFDGLAGNDVIDGRGGFDVVRYDGATRGVNVDLFNGIASDGQGGTDTLLNIEGAIGSNFDDTLFGNAGNNRLEGRSGNDIVIGDSGNDTLDGGSGNDTLGGGLGNDSYFVDTPNDVVIENAGEGTDSINVVSSVNMTYTLPLHVESGFLQSTGTAVVTLVGNSQNNLLNGSALADILQGGAGDDTLQGGAGNDTLDGGTQTDIDWYDARSATGALSINLATGTATAVGLGTDSLTGIEGVFGTPFNDSATAANTGINFFQLGAGNDTVTGGTGAGDIVDYSDSPNPITFVPSGPNAGTATGFGTDMYTAVEGLYGSQHNDSILGSSGNETIRPRAGNDTADGGAGTDRIDYRSATGSVVVNLATGSATGADGNDVLSNFENLRGSFSFGDTLIGNDGANVIEGMGGNDSLVGGGGDDSLRGGSGDDTLVGGSQTSFDYADYSAAPNGVNVNLATGIATGEGTDTLVELEGVIGSTLGDVIVGSALNNYFWPNQGDDTIDGGDGFDLLAWDTLSVPVVVNFSAPGTGTATGGSGTDDFVNIEGIVGTNGADTITLSSADEFLRGNLGNDTLNGGGGVDRIDYRFAPAAVTVNLATGTASGGDGDDVLTGFENARGSNSFGDTLTGDAGPNNLDGVGGNDSLQGAAGNDTLLAGTGVDTVDGGADSDTLVLISTQASYTLSRPNNSDLLFVNTTTGENITARGVENFQFSDITRTITELLGNTASNFNDTLTGTANNDTIDGLGGDDIISGLAGDDLLIGSDGNDTLDGGDGVDALNAGNGNDSLIGGEGNDSLIGGAGIDTMAGGAGDDLYELDSSSDVVVENADAGFDIMAVQLAAAGSVNMPPNVEQLLTRSASAISVVGNTLNNLISGNAGNDNLQGDAGNDSLNGFTGTDTLAGGSGDDEYEIESPADQVVEAAGEGMDRVRLGFAAGGSYTLPANVEVALVTIASATNVLGNASDNTITGGAGNNSLTGGAGNDSLLGGPGLDALQGGDGNDTLQGEDGADNLQGEAGDDVLNAAAGNSAAAAAGNDTLDGGTGNDLAVLPGLRGDYSVQRTTATDTVLTGGGRSLTLRGIENVQFNDGTVGMGALWGNTPSAFDDILVGDANNNLIDGLAGNDSISGLDGNDTLIGGPGNDTLVGGLGDDVYSVDSLADRVFEAAGEGTDSIQVAITTSSVLVLPAHVENAVITTTAVVVGVMGNALDNQLTGSSASNLLVGGEGNDTLDGGAGVDTMAGGAGDDLYRVDSVGDVLDETAVGSSGLDTVELQLTAAGTFVLPTNVENARIDAASLLAVNVTGNAQNNRLEGGAGNNVLLGLAGNDTLVGGAGNDTLDAGEGDSDFVDGGLGNDSLNGGLGLYDHVSYAQAPAAVSVNLATGLATGGAGNDTLAGFERVTGSDFADSVVGTAGSEYFSAGAGNDTLRGGGGADLLEAGEGDNVLDGGDGDDEFITNSTGNDLIDGGAGTDMVYYGAASAGVVINLALGTASGAGLDTLVGIENASGSRFADTLIGDAGDNALQGGEGADAIDGGAGSDTVRYNSETLAVNVNLATGIGLTATGTDTLANIENISGGQQDDTLMGDTSANRIDGWFGNDSIDGGAGNDTLFGGSGNDTLFGGEGNDTLTGGSGLDSLFGGTGNDTYQLTNDGDWVTEDAASGFDTVILTLAANFSYTLPTNIEAGRIDSSGAAVVTLIGNSLNNVLTGGALADHLQGGSGEDTLQGGAGNDTLDGGTQLDFDFIDLRPATGGASVNLASGTATAPGLGSDVLIGIEAVIGTAFNDAVTGGPGAQAFFQLGAGNDTVVGGGNFDIVDYGDSPNPITFVPSGPNAGTATGYGTDVYSGIEGLFGSNHNDRLTGSAANETLRPRGGDDTADGGAGTDRVDYRNASGSVLVNLATGSASGADGNDVLLNFENVRGSLSFGDTLIGNDGNNLLDGSGGNDLLEGGGGDDTLRGSTGDDTLDGAGQSTFYDTADFTGAAGPVVVNLSAGTATGEGSDTLINIEAVWGSVFNDLLIGDGAALNHFWPNLGDDTIQGGDGVDVLALDTQNTPLLVQFTGVGSGTSVGHGNDEFTGIEWVLGGNANDTMLGAAGDETFRGGLGNDSLDGGAGTDAVDYRLASGPVTVNLATGTASGADGNDTLLNMEGALGSVGFGDTLTGNATANRLDGRGGNDSLNGAAGNDTLIAGTGVDTVDGGADSDTLVLTSTQNSYVITRPNASDLVFVNTTTGENVTTRGIETFQFSDVTLSIVQLLGNVPSAFNDVLIGTPGDDRIDALAGDDSVSGLAGNDQLIGGLGNDTLDGGEGNDNLDGGAGNDSLLGGAGNDSLGGGAGVDTLAGGEGDDLYIVDQATDAVQEQAGQGRDTVYVAFAAGGVYTLPAAVEDAAVQSNVGTTLLGNDLNNSLVGSTGADSLSGGAGNDTLWGATGSDTLVGGSGDDLFYVLENTDQIVEAAGGGFDTVVFYATTPTSFTLAPQVEQAVIEFSNAAINITGNTLDNILVGNSGNNQLFGGAGNDSIQGQQGNDSLVGDAGNDTLVADAGNDTADGGADSDLLVINAARNAFTVARPTATDTVISGNGQVITLRGVEAVQFTDGTVNIGALWGNTPTAFDDVISGDAGDNRIDGLAGNDSISGLAGNDTLIGGAGIDTLVGGLGDDLFQIDVATDQVVELLSEGADVVWLQLGAAGTFTLPANIETARVMNAVNGVNVLGNELPNWIMGGAGINSLVGNAGNDTLIAVGGNDSLAGGADDDVYILDTPTSLVTEVPGAGNDEVILAFATAGSYTLPANVETGRIDSAAAVNLSGNGQDNLLIGGVGANSISGGLGNDTLWGEQGNDTLDGGDGADQAALGAARAAFTVLRPNLTDTVLTGNGQVITLRNMESVRFSDGTVTMAQLWVNVPSPLDDVLTGTAGNDNIDGLAGNDTLLGLEGNDTLTGGTGNDSLVGGLGDDIYGVDALLDQVVEAAGEGTDTVNVALVSAGTYPLPANVENANALGAVGINLTGNALDNLLVGNSAGNALVGGAGNDSLDGGAGIDTLTGGTGDDQYAIDNPSDQVAEAAGEGFDTVRVLFAAAGSYTLPAHVEAALVMNAQAVNLTGNLLDNTLNGGAGANNLSGAAGNDSLFGGAGNDTLAGGDGSDTLAGQDGSDSLLGDNGDDRLEAGGAGAATGNDTLDGGLGSDLAVLSGARSDYHVTRLTALDTQLSGAGRLLLLRGVENVQFSDGTLSLAALWGDTPTPFDDVINGTAGDNSIDGLAGNDSISGLAGNDTLVGGAGNDTLVGGMGDDVYGIDSLGDVVVEAADEGTDRVNVALLAAGTYTLPAHVEEALITSALAINLVGNSLANALTGNAQGNNLVGGDGDDSLNGGAGNDTLVGGLGNDLYQVDNASDVITETALAGGGEDSVLVAFSAAGSFTLPVNVENAQIVNALAVNLVGNASNNRLADGAGNNSLSGAAGDDELSSSSGSDTLDGGDNTDTAVLPAARAAYVVSRPTAVDTVLTGNGQSVTLRYVEAVRFGDGTASIADLWVNVPSPLNDTLIGTAGNDSINGAAGNDSISGLQGNDTLVGGTGNDTLVGGEGDDTFEVDTLLDQVVEAAGEGTDTVNVALVSAGTYPLPTDVENANALGTVGINLTGNALDNRLLGNSSGNALIGAAGNDSLDGAAGSDTLTGGTGDDRYTIDVASDVVVEAVGEGFDSVVLGFTAAGSYTLPANVEAAVVSNALAVNLTGNTLDNPLTGGAGANNLSGAAGNDTLIGGDGNDTLLGGDGQDFLQGDAGNDSMAGDAGNDTLLTSAGNDTADGGTGTDLLVLPAARASYSVNRSTAFDTVLTGNGQSVTLRGIEAVQFTDGTLDMLALWGNTPSAFDDVITGDAGNNLIDGLAGNDSISGQAGNDTLIGGAGNDTLVGNAGDDVFVVDVATDVVVEAAGEGTDTVNVQFPAAGSYTLPAFVENALITGTANANVVGNSLDNLITGNNNANNLFGAAGNDTLIGGAGNDVLAGGTGDDQYEIDSASDGVTEAAGEGADHVRVNFSAAGSYTLPTNVETATVQNSLAVNLLGNTLANRLVGGNGNNSLAGADGDDSLDGLAGNDTLDGGNGSDLMLLVGTLADWSITRPSATQTLFTGSGRSALVSHIELVQFGADSPVLLADLIATIGSPGNDTLNGGAGADNLSGGAGNDLINGGAGPDVLQGQAGNDTLVGGADVDYLDGGDGSDEYRVGLASDIDVIEQNDPAAGSLDSIVLGAGISAAQLQFSRGYFDYNDLVITIFTGNGNGSGSSVQQAVVAGFYAGEGINPGTIDQLRLASGQVFTQAQLAAVAMLFDSGNHVFVGLAGNDTLTGDRVGPADDWINGQSGNDSLLGLAGNDTLFGSNGDDNLVGGDGNDLLVGGAGNDNLGGGNGNDALTGGQGSDRYLINLGGGEDLIAESYDATAWGSALDSGAGPRYALSDADLARNSDFDLLQFGAGINPSNLVPSRSGNDLVLSVLNTSDRVTVKDAFANGVSAIELFTFASGAGWTMNQVRTMLLQATAGNDTLIGYQGSDILQGLAGNDVLDGREGVDYIFGGEGADTLTGGSGNDLFFFGAGTLTSTDVITDFTPGSDRVVISIATYSALAPFIDQRVDPDSNNFLAYDPATGALSYDADGEGVGAPGVVIALMGLATHPGELGLDILVGS